MVVINSGIAHYLHSTTYTKISLIMYNVHYEHFYNT